MDCGKHGVGVTYSPPAADGAVPKTALLGENAERARPFRNVAGRLLYKKESNRPLQFYNLLQYALDHCQPISLSWHLKEYNDDPIKAITVFCNTTCWGFVDNALWLFSNVQITGTTVDELANLCNM